MSHLLLEEDVAPLLSVTGVVLFPKTREGFCSNRKQNEDKILHVF